jgi:glyoxylase-like metal-dependent hydrolase (beta-lactamase superfamily II)/8-oxo-dGTP pyrophosphatase MutT (NUDIX family)
MRPAAPHAVPADARAAASLILLRDAPAGGVEVLMLRRAERDGDLRSGAVVFPGGVLDRHDRAAHGVALGPDDAAWSARLGVAAGGLDYAVAALRETFEEVGLLLASQPDGAPMPPAALDAAHAAWRGALQRGEAGIAAMCEALHLRLDARGLVYSDHWLTPPGVPKRFDTRFFTALAPVGQEAVADAGEAVELMWVTPEHALSKAAAYKLLPVTRRLLEGLAKHASAEAALAEARSRAQVPLVMPRRGAGRDGRPEIVLPDGHAWGEIARLDREGRGDVATFIEPGRVVDLSVPGGPVVLRVTAPNAGMMTGPGTNSYLVAPADGASPFTVIDPGPAGPAHVQRLVEAAGARGVSQVLATHTHVDHSPGAAALAAATGARVIGRCAPPHPGQDAAFAPHHEPLDGERLVLGPGATLRAIHTPGHASNHVCWLLEEEQLLFTGDQVMQGSTVVINPPDGDMAAYLRALRGLLDVPLAWLAPGHGFVVADPHGVIRALIAHRLAREAKVRAALAAAPAASMLDALLPAAYGDVPAALHPVARRSLLAHLLKLREDGEAVGEGDGPWSPSRSG